VVTPETNRVIADATLVRRLVDGQFPQWRGLPLRAVDPGGWDNTSFRLGDSMVVRLPRAADYEAQVGKEHQWLPRLARFLPLEIPMPVAIGKPADGYPWKWSIYRWIEGDTAASARICDLNDFARTLARFLEALEGIDSNDGPRPGPHNFHRGGSLEIYDTQTRHAIARLDGRIDARAANALWDAALKTSWSRAPVWVHGDISAGNLLLREARLSAIIDFGMLGIGDPACDLAVAWTLLSGESRETFRATLALDSDTWTRGRAWALWKASILAAELAKSSAAEVAQCSRVISEVLE
jgi:aminoglycoside phosphotransferase (APT) family kinase protein